MVWPSPRVLIQVARFGDRWNILGLDLLNQPHGSVTWGSGAASTDWNKAAESVADFILAKYPQYRGLFFVEGIESKSYPSGNWGGDLRGG